MSNTNKVDVDFTMLAIVLMVLFFHSDDGQPSIRQALVHYFGGTPVEVDK